MSASHDLDHVLSAYATAFKGAVGGADVGQGVDGVHGRADGAGLHVPGEFGEELVWKQGGLMLSGRFPEQRWVTSYGVIRRTTIAILAAFGEEYREWFGVAGRAGEFCRGLYAEPGFSARSSHCIRGEAAAARPSAW